MTSQLEDDVALLARAVAHMMCLPGRHARWTTEDAAALTALLGRVDPAPASTYTTPVDPTAWETEPVPHDDLTGPARPA